MAAGGAATLGSRVALIESLIESLPLGYETQLGQWFEGGRELSTGEWKGSRSAPQAIAPPPEPMIRAVRGARR